MECLKALLLQHVCILFTVQISDYLYSQYLKYLQDILGSPCRGHGNWYFERVLWMENYWVQHVFLLACLFLKSALINLCSFYLFYSFYYFHVLFSFTFGKSEHYIYFLDVVVLF